MLKENYLTEKNMMNKIKQWKQILAPYNTEPNSFAFDNFTFDNSALLVIDMQNYFLDEKSHAFVPSGMIALKNIIKLADAFRKHQKPVIFTYFAVMQNEEDPIRRWWNDTVMEGSYESRIVDELHSKKEDINNENDINNITKLNDLNNLNNLNYINNLILRKRTYSPFYKTKLEEFLRKNNIKNIVITGVLTNLCCETAVREAFVRNFNIFFPIDATAAYNEEMHIATLKNLSYGFAVTISTEEVLGKRL